MKTYIEHVIGEGETVEYQANISRWSLLGSGISALCLVLISTIPSFFGGTETGFFTVVVLFFALSVIGRALIAYYCTEMALTNRRFIAKVGFIRRDTIEINLNRIESIQINQGIFGRIFNYGTIIMAGTGTSHAPIGGIDDPLIFRKKFDEIIHKHQAV